MKFHLPLFIYSFAFGLILFLGSGCAIPHKATSSLKKNTTPNTNEKRVKKIDLLSSQITKLYNVPLCEKNTTITDHNVTVSKSDTSVHVVIDGTLVFKKGSRYLRKKAKRLIEKLVSLIKYDKTLTIQVVGHADSSGDKRKNQALSDARAISVAELFYAKGIKENLYAKGCGAQKPLHSEKNDLQSARNRRVEIYIYPEKSLLKNPCK